MMIAYSFFIIQRWRGFQHQVPFQFHICLVQVFGPKVKGKKRKGSNIPNKSENILWIELNSKPQDSDENKDDTNQNFDIYYPGDFLEGNVKMICNKSLFVNNVSVQFSCVEMVSIKNDNDEQITEHIVYNHSVLIFDEERLFDPGTYSFPFKWQLPDSPTSSLPSPTGFGFFEVLLFFFYFTRFFI